MMLLVAAAISLSGCGWIFGKSHPKQAESGIIGQPSQTEYGRTQIAEGRKALDRGDHIAAIIAFSKAQRIPQFAAEAHNGMAIGYARVGRTDLADRYFRLAILEAPEESRFRDNLTLLQQGNARSADTLKDRSAALAQNGRTADAPRVRNTAIPGVQIERPKSRLTRSPTGEMVITTVPAKSSGQDTRLAASGN